MNFAARNGRVATKGGLVRRIGRFGGRRSVRTIPWCLEVAERHRAVELVVTNGRRAAAAGLAVVLALAVGGVALAVGPPAVVNYQGVLRDASNAPQTGAFDMVFRFFSAPAGGDEIIVDRHRALDGNPVGVGGGLFNVQLGNGVIADGAGPNAYGSLSEVFRDYTEVFLSVEIGGEVLAPRIPIVSAAYALNADHLDGIDASGFIDTSGAAQSKAGSLAVEGTNVNGGGIGFPDGGAISVDANLWFYDGVHSARRSGGIRRRIDWNERRDRDWGD